MNKQFEQKRLPRSSSKNVCFYIFLLDLYKNCSSWLHSDVFSGFSHHPLREGVHPFYTSFLSFFHLSPPHVDLIINLLDTCPISTFLKSLEVIVKLKVTV